VESNWSPKRARLRKSKLSRVPHLLIPSDSLLLQKPDIPDICTTARGNFR